ncbi:MAG: trigger factor [Stappiaceae bacterium]
MQVTENLAEGLKRELKVVVPASDLSGRLDDYLVDMKSKVKINGFRPGKVPLNHLKRLYGRQAMAEILGNLINETTKNAVDERKERPALQPEIDLPDEQAEKVLDGKEDLSYLIKYEIIPEFELQDFKGLKVERPIVETDEAEIDDQISKIAESNRPFEARAEGVASETGDRITMAYVGKIDGEAFEGGADENGQLVLGSGQFIPGFEDQLLGAKSGDELQVNVKFPDEYQAEHLAGKDAVFDVTVKEVAAPGEVTLDDAFAEKLGLESLDKLKEIVRGQVESQYGTATRQKVKRQLLDQLDEMYDFELPEKLLETEFDGIWQQVQQDMERESKSFEDEDTSEEDARAEYQKIAKRRVRLGLVLSEIGEKNDVQVSDDEVQKALYERVRQFPGQEQQVFEFYQKNPNAVASLRAPIFEDKVIDFLLELADVTDKTVSKEELLAEDDEEGNGES